MTIILTFDSSICYIITLFAVLYLPLSPARKRKLPLLLLAVVYFLGGIKLMVTLILLASLVFFDAQLKRQDTSTMREKIGEFLCNCTYIVRKRENGKKTHHDLGSKSMRDNFCHFSFLFQAVIRRAKFSCYITAKMVVFVCLCVTIYVGNSLLSTIRLRIS